MLLLLAKMVVSLLELVVWKPLECGENAEDQEPEKPFSDAPTREDEDTDDVKGRDFICALLSEERILWPDCMSPDS